MINQMKTILLLFCWQLEEKCFFFIRSYLYTGGERVSSKKLVNKNSLQHVNRGSRLDFLIILSNPTPYKNCPKPLEPLTPSLYVWNLRKFNLILKLKKISSSIWLTMNPVLLGEEHPQPRSRPDCRCV
jgi:hypothetical protein